VHDSRLNAPTRIAPDRLDETTGALGTQDIFVRAHAPARPGKKWKHKISAKWPSHALIFDTETTLDTKQQLTIGCYRRCKLERNEYRCIEEGVFYADSLDSQKLKVLKKYVDDPANVPNTRLFPPQIRLKLFSRNLFVSRVFWRAVRSGDLIVGFNLPFDLSRLAVRSSPAKKGGGWSLELTMRKSRKTGKMELNPERPRIVITSQNSKTAFIKLSSLYRKEEWPNDARFLDLRTLTFALRDKSFNLERACFKFGVPGKLDHKTTGQVTPTEIKYCREDVAATSRLLNAARAEFDRNPINVNPDQAYSPASIAKAYLDAMNVALPKEHFKVSKTIHGIAMQSYYGGRAECRIRKTAVPVVHTDFTSQYPTVNALLGNWNALKANSIRFVPCTQKIRTMLSTLTLADTFKPEFWKQLSFFALVRPDSNVLPVRTIYKGRTQNIGVNHLTSKNGIWYAGPDIVASILLNENKMPPIIKAVQMLARGEQAKLAPTNLGGMVPIDPRKDDFFIRVVQQRALHKPTDKPLADFLKVIANSGSYGLFVQIDTAKKAKPVNVTACSGEKRFKMSSAYIEKSGPWYFPPLASLITSGGRLLLAMLERSIENSGGSYLFCDTDSMCVVASEHGGLVPCVGGGYALSDQGAIKALSFSQIDKIADQFQKLNPYGPAVREILKIEDINHEDSDKRKPRRQLFGYAVSSKRYVLYTQNEDGISVVKASGHGLGYLNAPKEKKKYSKTEKKDDDDDVPPWVMEAWKWLLCKELGLQAPEPTWLELPAMMRMAMTSPDVMRNNRPEWLSPFNFFLLPILDEGGYPAGFDTTNFKFIVPAEHDRRKWSNLEGVNLFDGQTYRIRMTPDENQREPVPDSMRIVLREYLAHPEAKSLGPDGMPCTEKTVGLLRRARIIAKDVVPVGKETDRHWEQGGDLSLVDFKVKEYRKKIMMAVAPATDRKKWKELGIRPLIRRSRLAQATVYDIVEGRPVKNATLGFFRRAIDV